MIDRTKFLYSICFEEISSLLTHPNKGYILLFLYSMLFKTLAWNSVFVIPISEHVERDHQNDYCQESTTTWYFDETEYILQNLLATSSDLYLMRSKNWKCMCLHLLLIPKEPNTAEKLTEKPNRKCQPGHAWGVSPTSWLTEKSRDSSGPTAPIFLGILSVKWLCDKFNDCKAIRRATSSGTSPDKLLLERSTLLTIFRMLP